MNKKLHQLSSLTSIKIPKLWDILTKLSITDGGFLQWGHPNKYNPSLLLGDTACKCIMVIPAYRLNVFGFLASNDLQADSGHAGNFGFWDQREALGWTVKYISHFGGNKDLITLGGFSAGKIKFSPCANLYHRAISDLIPQEDTQHTTSWPTTCSCPKTSGLASSAYLCNRMAPAHNRASLTQHKNNLMSC